MAWFPRMAARNADRGAAWATPRSSSVVIHASAHAAEGTDRQGVDVRAVVPSVGLARDPTLAVPLVIAGTRSFAFDLPRPLPVEAMLLLEATVAFAPLAVAIVTTVKILPGPAQGAVALAVESTLDPVALAVEMLGQGVLTVGRGDHREQVQLQVDRVATLVEAPVIATRFADRGTIDPAVARVGVSAVVAMRAMTSVAGLRRAGQGERREGEAARRECAQPLRVRFAILRMHRMFLLMSGLIPHSKSEDLAVRDAFRTFGADTQSSRTPQEARQGAGTPGQRFARGPFGTFGRARGARSVRGVSERCVSKCLRWDVLLARGPEHEGSVVPAEAEGIRE